MRIRVGVRFRAKEVTYVREQARPELRVSIHVFMWVFIEITLHSYMERPSYQLLLKITLLTKLVKHVFWAITAEYDILCTSRSFFSYSDSMY